MNQKEKLDAILTEVEVAAEREKQFALDPYIQITVDKAAICLEVFRQPEHRVCDVDSCQTLDEAIDKTMQRMEIA